jgi:hypothetical protein
MWLFTQHGFISAVQHDNDDDTIIVRARDARSLEFIAALFEVPVERTPANDYPYRVFVRRADFMNYLSAEVDMLDYPDYKARLHATRGDDFYAAATHVWRSMHAIEDDEARDEVE